MLFNVWVLIWPNQKKILGIVAATDEQKAKARHVATLASRTNFVLSLPMLTCMTGSHTAWLSEPPGGGVSCGKWLQVPPTDIAVAGWPRPCALPPRTSAAAT